MDYDYDPNVSGGGNRGSTSLPKFNHLYPILFFSNFIRFCGANKCGGPLSSHDGRIESIVTLEDSRAVEEAEMSTPSRASVAAEESSTPQPRGGRGRSDRPPRPSDVDDATYRAATQEARDKKKRAERYVDDCRAIAGYLSQAVAGDPAGPLPVWVTAPFLPSLYRLLRGSRCWMPSELRGVTIHSLRRGREGGTHRP